MVDQPLDCDVRGRVIEQDGNNLVCSAISDDGTWVAVSDATKLSLYQLVHNVRPSRGRSKHHGAPC